MRIHPTGRAWGKTRSAQMIARYEAAVWLEHARQAVRECLRYGFPVSQVDVAEVGAAEQAYVAATAALRQA